MELEVSNEDILEVEAIKEIKSKTNSTCGLDGNYRYNPRHFAKGMSAHSLSKMAGILSGPHVESVLISFIASRMSSLLSMSLVK